MITTFLQKLYCAACEEDIDLESIEITMPHDMFTRLKMEATPSLVAAVQTYEIMNSKELTYHGIKCKDAA